MSMMPTIFLIPLLLASPVRAANWDALWTAHPALVDRGPLSEYDNKNYKTLTSRHFTVHYSTFATYDVQKKARYAAERLDNLYEFLSTRMKVTPKTPIRAVLLPSQYGRSRVFMTQQAITTGDKGGERFIVGSFFHELVHYFNLSIPGGRQDFWSGELSAQYYDDRLLSGRGHRKRFTKNLSARDDLRDWSLVGKLHSGYKNLLDDEPQLIMQMGVSALYFLENEYGERALICFWKRHLGTKRRDDSNIWKDCFDKSRAELEDQWEAYYGFNEPRDGLREERSNGRTGTKLTKLKLSGIMRPQDDPN